MKIVRYMTINLEVELVGVLDCFVVYGYPL